LQVRPIWGRRLGLERVLQFGQLLEEGLDCAAQPVYDKRTSKWSNKKQIESLISLEEDEKDMNYGS
jgi:hypothetical protein